MKLKYEFSVTEMGDCKIAVALFDGAEAFNGFLKMNDVGAAIFDKLNDEISLEELIRKVSCDYPEESIEEISEVVKGFVEKLCANGIVE